MLMDKSVCGLSRTEYIERITAFHGYAAPGLLVGGFMVDAARRGLPEGTFFEALCETTSCLPDAVQLFTPCTTGNGWMRVKDMGRYALALYDKYNGQGFRVWLDHAKMAAFPEFRAWFLKLKPKHEQNNQRLEDEIFEAGESVLSIRPVLMGPGYVGHRTKGVIAVCPVCAEGYPAKHGPLCLGCRGENPYATLQDEPELTVLPVEEALGQKALHDMTMVEPGVLKDVGFAKGQTFTGGDLCRLQRMGRSRVYVAGEGPGPDFIHEDDAAIALSEALCARGGLLPAGPPREGKITLRAARDGLYVVDRHRLAALNALADVALASRHDGVLVREGQDVAGIRAIPLYLARSVFDQAAALVGGDALADVLPVRQARAGVLVTGTEVFSGLVEDKFAPVMRAKLEALGSVLQEVRIAPDDADAIAAGLRDLLESGCDLVLTTAGMSVDPDDVTRKGMLAAGAADMLFGMPVLPGNMLLTGRIGQTPLIGVPACALFHKITSLDLILPRVLAGQTITRSLLVDLGHGGFCMNCATCTFPHCPYGK